MKKITNESGIFLINRDGVLTDFQCANNNEIGKRVWKHLDIPEEVRVIPGEIFRNCEIRERLRFPQSLRKIGTDNDGGPFSWSRLPEVNLPETLEELGDFAFGHSQLRSLRIPKGLKSKYNRQFKGSSIGTLYLPEEFRTDDHPLGFREQYEHGWEQYGYIRSILVNNVEIGKVKFEQY